MSVRDDDRCVWHLGSQPRDSVRTDYRALNIGKPISDVQYESHQLSSSFLEETFNASAFAGFQKRYNHLKMTMSSSAATDARTTQSVIQLIHQQLDDLLSALRRFDDRTSHALSQRYGADSRELAAFKQALSFEFDEEFAYRFSWHLRNYSDHRGSPISHIRRTPWYPIPDLLQQRFEPLFNSESLLANHDWHTRPKEDLQEIDGEFLVGPVVDALHSSCKRAYCKGLLAQETSITAALEIIQNFSKEATTNDNLRPLFIRVNSRKQVAQTSVPLPVSVVRVDLADAAEAGIQEARVVAGTLGP